MILPKNRGLQIGFHSPAGDYGTPQEGTAVNNIKRSSPLTRDCYEAEAGFLIKK
jgi:hypothetical protein